MSYRTFAEIDAALGWVSPKGDLLFRRVMEAFEKEEGPSDGPIPIDEWFGDGHRWATVFKDDSNGQLVVTFYEPPGYYCDSYKLIPDKGWVHVEAGSFLDLKTETVRVATDEEVYWPEEPKRLTEEERSAVISAVEAIIANLQTYDPPEREDHLIEVLQSAVQKL